MDFDLTVAREIAFSVRCDPRTVMREWENPGVVRGILGVVLRKALAKHRESASLERAVSRGGSMYAGAGRRRA